MYELALWLETTFLADIAGAISRTGLSQMIQTNFWVIPTFQTVHILAIAAVFGSIFMINLRILGLVSGSRSMDQMSTRYMPWVWWGLLVLLLSGIILIIGEPGRELLNPAFWLKMILVLVAVGIGLWFKGAVQRNAPVLDTASSKRAFARVGAVLVILLFAVIAVLGRWIAYV